MWLKVFWRETSDASYTVIWLSKFLVKQLMTSSDQYYFKTTLKKAGLRQVLFIPKKNIKIQQILSYMWMSIVLVRKQELKDADNF